MGDDGTAASTVSAAESEKATETLSQFVARVLDQLSLSAWLPSAALVLALTFLFQLGTVLDGAERRDRRPGEVLRATFASMSDLSPGGALLLLLGVVVTTVVTQAFAFEAIRTLEGYWGTAGAVERLAKHRCDRLRAKGRRLRVRYGDLTREAWLAARSEIEREQATAIARGDANAEVREWSADMLTWLGAKLQSHETDVSLDAADRVRALQVPWQRYAPPDVLRRQVNLDKRLRDFPAEHRTLPTRLGNVLRAHEDQTGRSRVETLVLEVYERLPATLRRQHDEHRNRLDLYCSLEFVVLVLTLFGAVRLMADPWWASSVAVTLLIAAWLTYRAALASARVYGLLVIEVARRYPSS